jgi:AcrR family transcriptional regulator
MPRKKRTYHHGDLREAILSLALKAIASAPPEQLSLRELSRQAGVTSMALYRHFADKEALLSALAAAGFDDLGERMRAVEEKTDAKAALIAIGVVYVGFAVERPGLFRLMYGGTPPDTPPSSDEAPHAAYAALSRRISALTLPSQHKVAFLASWSLVHGLASLLVTNRIREPIADPIAVAKQICRFFIGAFD